MNFSISVVIPNYNGKILLAEVLPSVINALSSLPYHNEIIVVDDNSTDNSVRYLQENFEQVTIIASTVNLGFSRTVNKGLAIAKYDLVLILNNDVKLLPGYFEKQLRYFEKPETFGVNATVLNWDSDEVQGGGKIINRHLFKIKANENYYINPVENNDKEYLTMFLSGTNALIDRKKLMLLNGYDDSFSPFYVEDVELSVRALRMGWKMYYCPYSKCMHQISTTIKKHNSREKILSLTLRNKHLLHFIHLDSAAFFCWLVQTILEITFRTFSLKTIYLEAFISFNGYLKRATVSRRTFKKLLKSNNRPTNGLFKLLKDYRQELYKRIDTN